jgi:hypothetical protein
MPSNEKLGELVQSLNILLENPWIEFAGSWDFNFQVYRVSKEDLHCMNGGFYTDARNTCITMDRISSIVRIVVELYL